MIEVIIASTLTALATGLGAIPVILMGARAESLRPLLLGVAAGVMVVASVLGLIVPALDRGSVGSVAAGVVIGVVFLFGARRLLSGGKGHTHQMDARGTSILVFLVLFVHSLPEGFAIGTAFAEDPATIGLFIFLAISIQNIPEGTSVAIPLAAEGASPQKQISAAILTSVPQPIGAVIAFLLVETISGLLPLSFGFAAGAMLALSFTELVPQAWKGSVKMAVAGFVTGAGIMVLLDSLLSI
ncbi:MAG: ZIP family metal transporter [Solirubrobacterales bacterium]